VNKTTDLYVVWVDGWMNGWMYEITKNVKVCVCVCVCVWITGFLEAKNNKLER